MIRVKVIFIWMMAVMTQMLLATSANANTSPCMDHVSCEQPSVAEDGWEYSFEDGNVVATPVMRHGSSGPALESMMLPACRDNRPPSADGSVPAEDANCLQASMRCPPGEIYVWTYSRPAGSGEEWARAGQRCVGARQVVPVADLAAAVREELARRVTAPSFDVRPNGRTLVNLPVIAYATDSGRREAQDDCAHEEGVCFGVTRPLPGRLEARPVYTWVFAPGVEAEGKGRRYDGTDPSESGYYVSHTYQARGAAEVRLTVVWKATFTVDGLPAIELADLAQPADPASLSVLEARSELVAG